jgi:hypothetical protein
MGFVADSRRRRAVASTLSEYIGRKERITLAHLKV